MYRQAQLPQGEFSVDWGENRRMSSKAVDQSSINGLFLTRRGRQSLLIWDAIDRAAQQGAMLDTYTRYLLEADFALLDGPEHHTGPFSLSVFTRLVRQLPDAERGPL